MEEMCLTKKKKTTLAELVSSLPTLPNLNSCSHIVYALPPASVTASVTASVIDNNHQTKILPLEAIVTILPLKCHCKGQMKKDERVSDVTSTVQDEKYMRWWDQKHKQNGRMYRLHTHSHEPSYTKKIFKLPPLYSHNNNTYTRCYSTSYWFEDLLC